MKVFVFPLLYDNIATTLEATHLLSQILRGQESGHGLAGSPAQGLMNLHSRRWPRCPCHLELRVLFQACSDRWKTSLLAAAGLRCPCFSARCWMTSLPCGSQGQSTAQMFAFVWASWSESADFFFFLSLSRVHSIRSSSPRIISILRFISPLVSHLIVRVKFRLSHCFTHSQRAGYTTLWVIGGLLEFCLFQVTYHDTHFLLQIGHFKQDFTKSAVWFNIFDTPKS